MATKRLAAPPAPASAKPLASWRDRAAKSVQDAKTQLAKIPQQSGSFISLQGGSISLGGVQLANPLPVFIIAYGFERVYYARQYQAGVMSAPDCYSYDGERPHEKAKTPQADACASCHYNEFGSAQNGQGKGCKEGARLVIIHADAARSPEDVAKAQLVQVKLSVLNSKVFRAYADAIEDALWAAGVTMFHNRPDPKSQYAVSFVLDPVVYNDAIMNAIAARADEAEKLLLVPYPDVEETAAPAAPARRTAAAPLPQGSAARKRKF